MKTKIATIYNHHTQKTTNCDAYIVDYTEKAKKDPAYSGKTTELLNIKPIDIESFYVENNQEIRYIIYDGKSFVDSKGNSQTQCECVLFPENSNKNSWILFTELKYCTNTINNLSDFNKARKQVFKTQYYYKSVGIFEKTNTCYLIISLPKQSEPFVNISLNPTYITKLKRKHNIILRAKNSIKVYNNYILIVD